MSTSRAQIGYVLVVVSVPLKLLECVQICAAMIESCEALCVKATNKQLHSLMRLKWQSGGRSRIVAQAVANSADVVIAHYVHVYLFI